MIARPDPVDRHGIIVQRLSIKKPPNPINDWMVCLGVILTGYVFKRVGKKALPTLPGFPKTTKALCKPVKHKNP